MQNIIGENIKSFRKEKKITQKELAEKYPQLWKRFQARREYIINEYNIHLGKNVLPMTSTLVYLRPFLLNKQKAMKMNR